MVVSLATFAVCEPEGAEVTAAGVATVPVVAVCVAVLAGLADALVDA